MRRGVREREAGGRERDAVVIHVRVGGGLLEVGGEFFRQRGQRGAREGGHARLEARGGEEGAGQEAFAAGEGADCWVALVRYLVDLGGFGRGDALSARIDAMSESSSSSMAWGSSVGSMVWCCWRGGGGLKVVDATDAMRRLGCLFVWLGLLVT